MALLGRKLRLRVRVEVMPFVGAPFSDSARRGAIIAPAGEKFLGVGQVATSWTSCGAEWRVHLGPAATWVGVTGLVDESLLVEIEAVAVLAQ